MKIERQATEKEAFDVVVVGGGIGGIAAAVASSRGGAKTLLVEKGINLGGLATVGLISWYEPLCDGEGQQMIFGISEELIRLSTKYGFDNLPPCWGGEGRNKQRNQRFSTFYSPGIYAIALDRFVLDEGVALRFDTLATTPVMEGGICRGVIVESAGGCEFFPAKVVIDATGDASVMHRAGVPTVEGKNYLSYIAHGYTEESMAEYKENRDPVRLRKWLNSGSDMRGNGHPEGMTRIAGTDADQITDFVIQGKKRMLDRISNWDKNEFDLMMIPSMPQFRTIRRIVGNTDFCGIDGETFDDAIGACGDFRKNHIGKHYQIPFGALWNRDFGNLLACGRIISAPEGDGWEVTRVIPVCALTGEAAGKAAALMVREHKLLSQIDQNDLEQIQINERKEKSNGAERI